MEAIFSVRAVELLCSRLCHDLIGPVGAINNGVELIEEGGGGEAMGEALDLVADSARTAARRLALFRLALGAGSGGGVLPIPGTREALEGWFAGGRIQFIWRPALIVPPPGLLKLVLLSALIAEEALPRGGTLTLTGDDGGLELVAAGTGCGLREEALRVLHGGVPEAELTPRGILMHASLVTARFYKLAFTPARDVAEGKLTISLGQER